MIRKAAILTCLAMPAQAAEFEFCWMGANGYVLEGRMSVPDAALNQSTVTEDDVTYFAISGTRNGVPIGSWSLAQLTPTTSWNLNFDPMAMAFATGGYSNTPQGQQWNASGSVNNCGTPGFGFNSGGGGQDLCVDDTYRMDSIVEFDTPFPVYPLGKGPSCFDRPLLGRLEIQPRSAS